jgi:YYY domain-containing protein
MKEDEVTSERRIIQHSITVLILILILAVGAYLRFVGLNWDENSHPHPDERFLTMVETALRIPENLEQYFNTDESTINPHNAGYTFFVYGTFPIFIVRFLAEWIKQTGYDQVQLVGRAAAASFDMISILLVYLIGSRLYRKRVGLVAAAFTALSVLLIQHAHFFVVDSFANTFILIGIYFAVRAMDHGRLIDFVLFGVALGMSVASKVSAAPLALILVIAVVLRLHNLAWGSDGSHEIHPLNRKGLSKRFNDTLERLFSEEHRQTILRLIAYLALAAFFSLLTFRILQPYAFEGPSFFNIGLNEKWLANMAEIQRQQAGDADFPPALQWAMRTPVLFALQNMVLWGMGAPLGILVWVMFLWAMIRVFRHWELKHTILLGWIGIIFLWQSTQFTPAMRYQIPVYPTLSIMGAWGLWKAWDLVSSLTQATRKRFGQVIVGLVGVLVLASTTLWAFAFVRIYQEPMTQVAASRWIYKHIPGAINFVVSSEEGEFFEPSSVPTTAALIKDTSPVLEFNYKPQSNEILKGILINRLAETVNLDDLVILQVTLIESDVVIAPIASADFEGELLSEELEIDFASNQIVEMMGGLQYTIRLELLEGPAIGIQDNLRLRIEREGGEVFEYISLPPSYVLFQDFPYTFQIRSLSEGQAEAIYLPYVLPYGDESTDLKLEIKVVDTASQGDITRLSIYYHEIMSAEEFDLRIPLEPPMQIEDGGVYQVQMKLVEGDAISLRGSVIIHETTWDLALPMRIEGRDGFGGLYTSVNQEMYWHDDPDDDFNGISDKLERIADTLTEGDYLVIPTNRQYGTITRVPTRHPLSTEYYRQLFDCPINQSVLSCASKAEPGKFEGNLGYQLEAIFQSNPKIGPIEINDQAAEEAFTVYDHPKVLIFKKTSAYSEEMVYELLGDVDVSHVDRSPPGELTSIPSSILLPKDRLQVQREGGTWSDLFDRSNWINRYPFITTVVWWLAIGLFGLLMFPLTRVAFKGLYDGGYALARIVGLLALAWLTWVLGNAEIPVERPLIFVVFLLLTLISLAIAYRDREELKEFFKEKRKEILWVEVLAISLFLLDLAIRLGNPDLWHPFKGGEKPMNFSYLNAVLKSTTFPPFDPWFAGGYINYYYFGYVIVGMPIKLLGIVPSTAYNLVIPTLFSLLGLSAFSVGYNLIYRLRNLNASIAKLDPRFIGTIAAFVILIIGNFGSARLIYDGFKEAGGMSWDEEPSAVSEFSYAMKGMGAYLTGKTEFPVRTDRWYWDPSRAIEPGPGEAGPINEFPYFTFLYADLHAHMIDLPITVVSLAWGLSWILTAKEKKRISILDFLIIIVIGAMFLGAMRPTNTWDFPIYWGIAFMAVIAAAVYRRPKEHWWGIIEALLALGSIGAVLLLSQREDPGTLIWVLSLIALVVNFVVGIRWVRRRRIDGLQILEGVTVVGILFALAYFLYQPFNLWYKQGYTAARVWEGSQTQLNDYIVVHGFFLFLILSWMLWELRQWMARTPISALHTVRRILFWSGLILVGCIAIAWVLFASGMENMPLSILQRMFTAGMQSGLLTIPVLVLALVMLLKAGLPTEKRIVLFLVSTAIALTILVEVIVLEGDISRMNTVFKFYLQVWTLFALSAVASLAWIWSDISLWTKGWRGAWITVLFFVLFLVMLYPVTATPAKIQDRMAELAPHKLDGMTYMPYATYYDIDGQMDLEEDYEAILWMQENVQGSPVIVEANTPEYRWGSRFTIYTGLPGVLGWNWHQRQQRGFGGDNSVAERANAIAAFYTTRSVEEAWDFLDEFDVSYIVVGQLERQYYESVGPCTPSQDSQELFCDMAGRPMGMPTPEVPIAECTPMDDSQGPTQFRCPTYGLDKFEDMKDTGLLEVAFTYGGTTIYRVVQ